MTRKILIVIRKPVEDFWSRGELLQRFKTAEIAKIKARVNNIVNTIAPTWEKILNGITP
jgi:hypothetical protein